MSEDIQADICVIGGGSGGLAVAAGAAQLGAATVLVEAGKMGGDCLNYGCVPSKSMIAAAHAADAMRRADRFGIAAVEPTVDFEGVHDHIHGVIAAIAPVDSVDRFEGLGVRVIQARAAFAGPREVTAGDHVIRARRFVIATGSTAATPPIRGLDAVPYLTNETIFDNRSRPDHLIVIGGGPIGAELAQAHRRLGARVTVLEAFTILGKDDPELTEIVKRQLRAEGIDMREGAAIAGVSGTAGAIVVTLDGGEEITGSHLLVAAGRRPNVDGLGLEAAGIAYSDKGIEVDRRLRTSNRKVFAIGDVAGGPQFTHAAGYHAGIVVRNALFRLPAKGFALGHLYRPRTGPCWPDRRTGPGRPWRHSRAALAVRRERPRPGRTRGRRHDQGDHDQARSGPGGVDRWCPCRRADPALGAGDRERPQGRRFRQHDRALSDPRRGRQAGGGQFLHGCAFQRKNASNRALFGPIRVIWLTVK
jgi:pyruvate/2-oxoglutarate dehydrogenase complex dihydrolipoamide dehydrogenase (E3) component